MTVLIEEQRFDVAGQQVERGLRAGWVSVTGEGDTGKSTGLEALFLALGATASLKRMPAIAPCAAITTTLSIGDCRWRIGRRPGSGTVTFENTTEGAAPVHLPTSSRDPEKATASDFLLGLLGIPVLRDGGTKLTVEHILPLVYQRQASAGVSYMGGLRPELRELAVRAVLGLREDDVDTARASHGALRRELAAARRSLAGFEKIREQYGFTTPEELAHRRHRAEQDLAAARKAQQAAGEELRAANVRLQELRDAAKAAQPAAEAAAARADEAERQHRDAARSLGHAEGVLAHLRAPTPHFENCPRCTQLLQTEGLAEGLCPVCKQHDPQGAARGQDERIGAAVEAVAAAKAYAERCAKTAADARAAANTAHRAVRDAYRAADAFAQESVEPVRRRALDAEKRVRELAVLLEQLGERVGELVQAIESQKAAVARLTEQVKAAGQRLEDEEGAARARLAEVLKLWSTLFARRLATMGGQWHSAHIAERGFTPVVNGESFDQVAVAGPVLAVVELAALVSLREVGLEVPGSSVPGLLVVDAALAGLGGASTDEAVREHLLQLCFEAAAGQGPLSQIVTVSREPLTDEPVPGTRRLHLTPEDRYIPHPRPAGTGAQASAR